MHNLKTDGLLVSSIVLSTVCTVVEDGLWELKENHKLFLSSQWRVVKTDQDCVRCAQGTTLSLKTVDP